MAGTVGTAMWVRLSVIESPLFAREVEADTVARQPIIEVIKRNPREMLAASGSRSSGTCRTASGTGGPT